MKINCCGDICQTCELFNTDCQGCYNYREKPPQSKEKAMCPVYACAMTKFSKRSCSCCEKLPCELHYKCLDDSLSKEEKEVQLRVRVERLKSAL